ncbi:KRAB-A domain-containing protein 2-like, partial [Palaemon carinicauda]|uniref:KRAB-A domain-containing protein 2-like n=1 Tax=Palaemon carinicauda TaxID=392227 RepID=UPI0035B65527
TFGAPAILQSDNGREFVNAVIAELSTLWPEFKLVTGRPCHPQSQGVGERINGVIQEKLAIWMQENNIGLVSSVLLRSTINEIATEEDLETSVENEEGDEDAVTGVTAQVERDEDAVTGAIAEVESDENAVTGATAQVENDEDTLTGATAELESDEDAVTGATAETQSGCFQWVFQSSSLDDTSGQSISSKIKSWAVGYIESSRR